MAFRQLRLHFPDEPQAPVVRTVTTQPIEENGYVTHKQVVHFVHPADIVKRMPDPECMKLKTQLASGMPLKKVDSSLLAPADSDIREAFADPESPKTE